VKRGVVRVIAVCVFRRGDTILVEESRDETKGETFYRPLGGEVEFRESSRDATVREIREEIGAEITNVRFLGVLESLFTFEGESGHEIVMVYEADFADRSFCEREIIEGRESQGAPITARWMPLADFESQDAPPLYPDGLARLLASLSASGRMLGNGEEA
jgi:8-oxo-dGTP pyrophosphatase MutT (NUDIX family)